MCTLYWSCLFIKNISVFGGLTDPERNGLPRASQFLQIVIHLPVSVPFICRPINPEPTPQPPLLLGSPYSGPLSTCPNCSRARCQANRDSPYAPSPLKLFKLANCKPVYTLYNPKPGLSMPSNGNHNRDSCSHVPLDSAFWSALVVFQCDSPWHGLRPSLGICKCNKLSFQWQLSPDLLVLT